MNKRIFFFAFFTLPFVGHAQSNEDFAISFGTGPFNSPYYQNARSRAFYNVNFDYFFTPRHVLSVDFLKGNHRYYDSVNSNNAVPLSIPGYEHNANAQADYFIFSVVYKYAVVSKKKLGLIVGAGLGLMTQVILYPYTEGAIVDLRQASWTDLAFPIGLEITYRCSPHIKIGVAGGSYIQPDYGFLANHAGLKVSYIIRDKK